MMKFDQNAVSRKEFITVGFLFENAKRICKLELLSENNDFEKKIYEQNLHRSGLALAGFVDLFSYTRVQIFGNTEMRYLEHLTPQKLNESLEKIFKFDIPCIILTDNNKPIPLLLEKANKFRIPLFQTSYSTTKLVYFLSDFLDDQFSPRMSFHGSFVDVYGVGIMVTGKSGIGKSEVALDLIERGHRLVADDVIILTKKGEGILLGSATEIGQKFMEIRGLGIIDIQSIFGIRAIRLQKRLEIVVELEFWNDSSDYTRTGLEDKTINIMDVDIPYIKLPIIPGKNITVILEIIGLNYLLKHYGYDAAKVFQGKLNEKLRNKNAALSREVDYFEHDFE
ncbi:MAG TPA: HPr(Ser) kinase/phosphatase [Ignavibacteriaceae bacterium]|nr:MAG: HPr kinase/phosphorylase [Ignavibacteriota bacterium]HMN16092.1 HPr(Ser) kinase/phosphatase [Ignavibacteriaceae bacterium]